MTDPHTPDPSAPGPGAGDADLEVASAYLDGAATPEEEARVESDPVLRDQVDRFRTVRDRLAVGAPTPDLTDAHVSAALAAAREAAVAPVSRLDQARKPTRKPTWSQRVPLGAVAAALLLIALVAGIALRDTGSDTVASTDTDESSSGFDATAGGGGAAAMEEGAGLSDDGAARQDLEVRLVFDDNDALAAHLADQAVVASGTTAAAEAAPGPASGAGDAAGSAPDQSELDAMGACDPIAAADVEDAAVLAFVRAVVAGQDVTAVIVDRDGERQLLVVDEATCTVVDDRPLPDQ